MTDTTLLLKISRIFKGRKFYKNLSVKILFLFYDYFVNFPSWFSFTYRSYNSWPSPVLPSTPTLNVCRTLLRTSFTWNYRPTLNLSSPPLSCRTGFTSPFPTYSLLSPSIAMGPGTSVSPLHWRSGRLGSFHPLFSVVKDVRRKEVSIHGLIFLVVRIVTFITANNL